ncbi:MAG: protein kinase [Caldilineae bacterium]|nr:protein kinase [Chloroflexota bacterium]MCB9176455.1 protein kinase [Caldilineae bacterium]
MSDLAPTEPPGDLLNQRYRLVQAVGQGGMAVVWRAEDELLGRTVAVKILRDQYARDPEFLARFRSEARSAAALNDPGVVGVYDVGEDAGRHYLVLEYVPGRDLKQVIRAEAPLETARAVRIGADLARAVGQAHAVGLVHRDIKPQNVLITPDGRMKVADFGIARAVSEAGMTAPGIVLGTVHYLAPEQAAGRGATPASDVYSLGVVLYEMLTGKVPFAADSGVGVAMKILNEAPEPLDALNPKVPAALVAIVERAMAREPEARYADASALHAALSGYAEWADGATMTDFRPAPLPEGASATPPTMPAPRQPLPGVPGAAPEGGPLLDRTGLLLGLIALLAVAGLIPLWGSLAARLGDPARPGRPLSILDAGPTPSPEPTAEPTLAFVEVPAVEGEGEDAARGALEAVGLGVSVEYEADATVPMDRVIRQVPAAGSIESVGKVVKLVVSGDAQISVPALSGPLETVRQQLDDMGFVTRVRYEWRGAGSPSQGLVLALDPEPGSRVPYKYPVDITVDGGPWRVISVVYEDNLFLGGVTVDRASFTAGEVIRLVPTWEAFGGPVAGDYVLRAELWADDGSVLARGESAPLGSAGWAAGQRVDAGAVELQIPPETPEGVYPLWIDLHPTGAPDSSLAIRQNTGLQRTAGDRVQVFGGVQVRSAGAPAEAASEGDGG